MGTALMLYLFVVLVAAPVVAWRLAASGVLRLTPREVVYRSGMTTSWFLALAGATVLWMEQGPAPGTVGLTWMPAVSGVLWSAGTLAVLLAGMGAFSLLSRLLGQTESPDLLHLIPATRRERWLFAGLSVSAGITEEFIYRGIALAALGDLPWVQGHGGPWLAAAVVAAAFGLGHGYQDAIGMVRAGVLGFLLAVPVLITGSLLPGMAAHAALDLTLLARRPAADRRIARGPLAETS
jgi:membrane protease YdiL (CAAX protease family)